MGYKTLEIGCKHCEHVFDYLQGSDEPEKWNCPECGSDDCVKRIAMPKLTKASYLDGTKRPGFEEAKIASTLKAEMLDLPPAERKKIQAEIKKTGSKNTL